MVRLMPMWPALFPPDTGWLHPCFLLGIILACTVPQDVTFEEPALVTAMPRSALTVAQSGQLGQFLHPCLSPVYFISADSTTDSSLNH